MFDKFRRRRREVAVPVPRPITTPDPAPALADVGLPARVDRVRATLAAAGVDFDKLGTAPEPVWFAALRGGLQVPLGQAELEETSSHLGGIAPEAVLTEEACTRLIGQLEVFSTLQELQDDGLDLRCCYGELPADAAYVRTLADYVREQIRFWQEMGRLFVDEHGNPVMDFPKDWDAMVAFIENFENRPWPEHEEGHMATHAVLDQFAHRYFPRPLHGLVRALVVSTLHPTTWRVHGVTPPPAPVRILLLRTVGLMLRVQKALLPDPAENYQQQLEALTRQDRRERAAEIRRLNEDFSAFFRKRHGLPPRATAPEAAGAPVETSFSA